MKNSKNNFCKTKNSEGFSVLLLLLLPSLLTFLGLIYRIVYVTEFKSEMRFVCINESLAIQRESQKNSTDPQLKSQELLNKLKNIKSPVKFTVVPLSYPVYGSENAKLQTQSLAFRVQYSSVTEYFLNCGIKSEFKGDLWLNEVIYATGEGKF